MGLFLTNSSERLTYNKVLQTQLCPPMQVVDNITSSDAEPLSVMPTSSLPVLLSLFVHISGSIVTQWNNAITIFIQQSDLVTMLSNNCLLVCHTY